MDKPARHNVNSTNHQSVLVTPKFSPILGGFGPACNTREFPTLYGPKPERTGGNSGVTVGDKTRSNQDKKTLYDTPLLN